MAVRIPALLARYALAVLVLVACAPSSIKGPLQKEAKASADSIVVATANAWTWVPVPGAECGNGSPTGFGVNLQPGDHRLVIYLEGGGMCASSSTCDPNGAASAVHLQGFGESDFLNAANHAGGILSRQDPSNPLATANYALVPYCTGDLHAGDKVASYGTHHRGFRNLGLYLRRIVPMFADVEQVVLAGSSAGGMGALWNWYRVQQAFGTREVILVNDSGLFLGPPVGSFTPGENDPWGASQTLPPGCQGCWPDGNFAHGPFNLYGFYAKVMPKGRGLLISSMRDHEMSHRYGLDGKGFAQTLDDLHRTYVARNPNFHVFLLDSARHVWLSGASGKRLGDIRSAGKSLGEVIAQAVGGDPQWRDVQP